VDAYLLVTGWNGSIPSTRLGAVLSLQTSLHAAASTDTVYLTATVVDSTTPAGTVTFSVSGVQLRVGDAGRLGREGDGDSRAEGFAVAFRIRHGDGRVQRTIRDRHDFVGGIERGA